MYHDPRNPLAASTSTPIAVPSTFAALKARNYCFYWIGLVFYVLGHRAEYVTFAWMTWEVTRDPLSLGYLGLAQALHWSSFSSSVESWPIAPIGCGC
jgi:hypothetical protein